MVFLVKTRYRYRRFKDGLFAVIEKISMLGIVFVVSERATTRKVDEIIVEAEQDRYANE